MPVKERHAADLPAPPTLDLSGAALFLDLDGTLAPIAATPDAVWPDPRRTQLLIRLQTALGGRLAMVSGRSMADIDRIVEGGVTAVAAVHGLVRREADGSVHESTPHPGLALAARRLAAFAAERPGLLVEDKRLSLALHYRQAPERAAEVRKLARVLAVETGLTLQHGAMVEELRTPGPDKGDSLCAFLNRAPFKGARPIFVGDDHTDEHGFRAAQSLGGMGIQVGPRRPTEARFALAGVDAVLDWLEASLPKAAQNPVLRNSGRRVVG